MGGEGRHGYGVCIVALLLGGAIACGSKEKAGIVVNVDTAADVNRQAITLLRVTVNDRVQSYDVTTAASWSLGIITTAGSKTIVVEGMAATTPIARSAPQTVDATTTKVVTLNVTLTAVVAGTDLDGGDLPLTTGGTPGADASPGWGGSTGAGGAPSTGGVPGSGGITGPAGSTGTSQTGGVFGSGGITGLAGSTGTSQTGGMPGSGGIAAASGATGRGGAGGTGGIAGTGGRVGSGGASATGGVVGTGGIPGRGGVATGGAPGTGGVGSGGRVGSGGAATGGSTSTSTSTVDCNAAMPNGGQLHSGNSAGGAGNLAWQIWSNQGSGTLTTFANTPAFSVSWGGSGDFLGRLGYEWGNSGKPYDQYGTITAQFTFKKSGSGGGYSYIGIYGWSANPCVEWYIVEDSFGTMPFAPYNATIKGTVSIDGESYQLYSNAMNGTGGSRCNVSTWVQFWSVRQKARQCGTVTISDHFREWKGAGMELGSLLEAKILVETGGGSGSVDFPIANVQIQ
jgi:endo-1,4-beta-xylanase